jgi:hypothetical protein
MTWVATLMVAHTMAATDLMVVLLQDIDDVFTMPMGLPPPHRHNHRVHLLPEMAPGVVRSYRYPQLVNDELKRQCQDMLQFICPSASDFSMPMLLMKKHDGTWHFHIGYRALDAKTVHNMFLIPIVDELLDKLRGTRFFTKLDMRSSYHKVWMHNGDITKMAFQTHHDHFEFLVITFSLTNALATFQTPMNDVLQEFIRHIVLIFFDNILIYNDSVSSHLQHVHAVLQ